MATFRKRKRADGSTAWQVQIRRDGCRPVSKTFSRKRDAETWATETERKLDLGELVYRRRGAGLTVTKLIERYLSAGVPSARGDEPVSASDRRNRIRQLDWWRGRIGRLDARRLTPRTVAIELESLRSGDNSGRGLSSGTCNRYLSALSTVLTWAVRHNHGDLRRNPLVNAALRGGERSGLDKTLDRREQAALVAAARDDHHPTVLLWVLLGLATGARQGELARLRWRDVRLVRPAKDGGVERCVLTFYRTKNTDPKVLALTQPSTVAVLHRMKRRAGAGRGRLILATNRTSRDAAQATFPKAAWARVRERAGLDGSEVVFHTLRHTHASLLLRGGCSLAEIGQGLGHRSPASTRRYIHLVEDHAVEIAERLAQTADW